MNTKNNTIFLIFCIFFTPSYPMHKTNDPDFVKVTLDSSELLFKRLQELGFESFAKKTNITKKIGGKTLYRAGVELAVLSALEEYKNKLSTDITQYPDAKIPTDRLIKFAQNHQNIIIDALLSKETLK